jgi:hypothetical protein
MLILLIVYAISITKTTKNMAYGAMSATPRSTNLSQHQSSFDTHMHTHAPKVGAFLSKKNLEFLNGFQFIICFLT